MAFKLKYLLSLRDMAKPQVPFECVDLTIDCDKFYEDPDNYLSDIFSVVQSMKDKRVNLTIKTKDIIHQNLEAITPDRAFKIIIRFKDICDPRNPFVNQVKTQKINLVDMYYAKYRRKNS